MYASKWIKLNWDSSANRASPFPKHCYSFSSQNHFFPSRSICICMEQKYLYLPYKGHISRWKLNIFFTTYCFISLIISLIHIFLQLIEAWTSTTRGSGRKKSKPNILGLGTCSTNLKCSPDYNLRSSNCLVLSRFFELLQQINTDTNLLPKPGLLLDCVPVLDT